MDAVKQRLFLHRTHVRFFQCLDVKADHIAWMLGKQGGKIVLRFRLIDDICDAETQLSGVQIEGNIGIAHALHLEAENIVIAALFDLMGDF